MLIPYSATQGYSMLLDRLSVGALADLDRLMASVAMESPAVQQAALMDLLPTLGEQYVGASSAVSAQFFSELQEMNGIRRPVEPETLPGVGAQRWHSLAGWGAGASMFEQGGAALVFSLLSGGLTKILTESAADTIVGNAANQGGMRSQRVPRPGCCAFCGMLASRFADYSSSRSAGKVVGRGAPISKNFNPDGSRRRGGQAGGVRPRGSRAVGEDFHDFCRCRIVAVTEKNEVEMQSSADKYLDSYTTARNAVNEKRRAEGYKGFGDQKETQKRILTSMREGLGVK